MAYGNTMVRLVLMVDTATLTASWASFVADPGWYEGQVGTREEHQRQEGVFIAVGKPGTFVHLTRNKILTLKTCHPVQ